MCENVINILESGFENIISPRDGDLGFDLIANSDPIIKDQFIEYDTNVRIEPPDISIHAFVFPRSSISNTNLILANSPALIDSSYRGSIKLRFRYIPQKEDFSITDYKILININSEKIYKKGDKIAQLIFFKDFKKRIQPIQKMTDSVRGEGGFGSTGR